MNVVAYSGIAHENNWAMSVRGDMLKTYCWKRGYTVSSVVAEIFCISRKMKLICENIK